MKEFWISCLLTIIAVVLLILAFLAPPLGIIDNSVLAGVGYLFGFTSLWKISDILKTNRAVTIKHKDTEIIIGNDNESDN